MRTSPTPSFRRPTFAILVAGCLAVGLVCVNETSAAEIAKRAAGDSSSDNAIAVNRWRPAGAGFTHDGDAFVCDNGDNAKAERGAAQTISLHQTTPSPIVATAWSRAENVDGPSDSNYAIYLDLTFTDGSHLWGQTAPFGSGTHDWQRRRVVIVPEKPIQTVSYYLLLRGHRGKAWFRNASLQTYKTSSPIQLFDGMAMETPIGEPQEGFQIFDAAAGGDIVRFQQTPPASMKKETAGNFAAEARGVRLTWKETQSDQATFFDVAISSDKPQRDRAVTLYYCIPTAGNRVTWCGSQNAVSVQRGREYAETATIHAGAGRLSRYPLAAVSDDRRGIALGIDMATPAVFRTAYHAGTGELYLAYDIALTREKPTVQLRFCRFAFDPAWQFRAAWARYCELFPEQFRRRIADQGIWMPFGRISKVEGWQDFGFRIKEGDDETAWDDAHGILTFHYTEPGTWWMSMPKKTPRTTDAAIAEARRLADRGDANAKALFASGMYDAAGRFAVRLLDTPWCNGAVWSMNSMPGIAGETTDFQNKWNAKRQEQMYGPKRHGDLDGEYIDSAEGYVTNELDFRREHFAAARTALTFSPDEHQPAIYRGLMMFEYIGKIAADIHGMNKLMMANATPGQLCWLVPLVDFAGTETDWNPENHWRPMSISEMFYRRALCKAKPYGFLMNTHFERFSHAMVEKYMKRSLAFGMFPGFFSADASTATYFSQPKLYNRDRPLFKKYLPLCKLVAEAGWEPVTQVRCDDAHVHLERFGARYLTVFNDSPEGRTASLLAENHTSAARRELVHDKTVAWTDGKATIALDAEDVAVVELP